tara:strand:- start:25507 stop:26511 length:1005 start_codon:yes stop_codon:yes gene_type:complete
MPKILITGGCGFVGSNLCLFLKKNLKNAKIFSLDNLKKRHSKINAIRLKKNGIKNFNVDVNNYKKIIKLSKYDYIIDCCAEPAVENSRQNSKKVIDINLNGTINLLEKIKKDKSRLIFVSSSRVYPIKETYKYKMQNKLFDENSNTIGNNTLYGATKLSSEIFIKEYNYAFNTNYLIFRSGLIYGPWQFGKVEQGLISLWLLKHYFKQKLNYIGFNGTGNQIRDLLYIDDFNKLILIAIKSFGKIKNQTFCIGGGKQNTTKLRKLTSKCEKLTKNKINIGKVKKTSLYDIPYFISSNNKVKKIYNWKPETSIDNGLKKTYLWIKSNKNILKKFK